MAILYDTYLVVALAFVLFFLILYRYKVQNLLTGALDKRAERIRAELDEAKRLREEAQTLLASYERKQKEIEGQAADIVARAKEDAQSAAVEAKKQLGESIERRLRAAEEQIANAESAAIREVKDRAVAIAVAAAADVLKTSMRGGAAGAKIDESISEVGRRLN